MAQALQLLVYKSKEFEAFNQRTLRDVLIEERRRYAYLVDNWCSVFDMDFRSSEEHLRILKSAAQQGRRASALLPTLLLQFGA
jgi:hypothetical protein